MLDDRRPVTVRDLDRLRTKLGLTTLDYLWVFGMPMRKWSEMRKHMDEPVPDPPIAIWARLLNVMPELLTDLSTILCPRPDASSRKDLGVPTAQEILDMLTGLPQYQDTPQRALSVMFGRDATASHRWLHQQLKGSPIIARLFHAFRRLVREKKGAGVELWSQIVETEARARGITDIWRDGLWRQRAFRAKKGAGDEEAAAE